MSVIEERLHYLDDLRLGHGSHKPPNNGLVEACVMEAVAYVAGEPWSDHPACASPVITLFLIGLNDRLGDGDRQKLKPYITRLVGTNTGNPADETTRRYMLLDWVAHEALPGLLRRAELPEIAEEMEALVSVTDEASAGAARDAFRSARDATWPKRQAWRAEIRRRVGEELKKRNAAAAAVAAAAAAAAADAVAAAVAVADAVAVAVAAVAAAAAADAAVAAAAAAAAAAVAAADAAAAASAAAVADARWNTVYDEVYKAVKPIYIEKLGEINAGVLVSALGLVDRMIEVGK